MRLVRRSTGGPIRRNGRAQDLAAAGREMMAGILGDQLAQDVANNAAMAFIDDDEIYSGTFADAVHDVLVRMQKHPPRQFKAHPVTDRMIARAVHAVRTMKTAAEMGLSEEQLASQTSLARAVVDEVLDEERLGKAVADWMDSPINEYGTPHVSHPLDFTPAEQGEFVDFVRQPRLVTREEQKAKLREIIAARSEIKPNGRRRSSRSSRASTLGGRASMDTRHVGRDVDPDRYTGARGKALDAAMSRYETFHAKRPLRAVELPHDLPTSVVAIGQVVSTMYRTDKWHKDGDDEDYKHVHDNSRGGKEKEYEFGKGVIAYEPVREASKSKVEVDGKRIKASGGKPQKLPVRAPGALSLLGYCLGVFVQRFDDGEVYELNPRGCYLFCTPKGDMLAVYSPDPQPDGSKGFLMVMAGGGLCVLKDGIDG